MDIYWIIEGTIQSFLFQQKQSWFLITGFALITIIIIAFILGVIGIIYLRRRQLRTVPTDLQNTPVTAPVIVDDSETTANTPYLEHYGSSGDVRQFRLDQLDKGGEFIGRAMPSEGITLRIDDSFPGWQTVSRHHAQLYRDDHSKQIIIKDNHSQNGIYVQEQRTPCNTLKDGWQIKIGEVEFIFRENRSKRGTA